MVHQSFEELYLVDKSSLSAVFFWKSVLKIFSKFTGEHPCGSEISIEASFTLTTKKKLHCSLLCSFYYCLVKEGWALKVA